MKVSNDSWILFLSNKCFPHTVFIFLEIFRGPTWEHQSLIVIKYAYYYWSALLNWSTVRIIELVILIQLARIQSRMYFCLIYNPLMSFILNLNAFEVVASDSAFLMLCLAPFYYVLSFLYEVGFFGTLDALNTGL